MVREQHYRGIEGTYPVQILKYSGLKPGEKWGDRWAPVRSIARGTGSRDLWNARWLVRADHWTLHYITLHYITFYYCVKWLL